MSPDNNNDTPNNDCSLIIAPTPDELRSLGLSSSDFGMSDCQPQEEGSILSLFESMMGADSCPEEVLANRLSELEEFALELNLDSLILPPNEEARDFVQPLVQSILTRFDLLKPLLDTIKQAPKMNIASRYHEDNREEVENILIAAYLSGILANPGDLRVYDIGGGTGFPSFVMGLGRGTDKGEMYVENWDLDSEKRVTFSSLIRNLRKEMNATFEFVCQDACGCSFTRDLDNDTYWFSNDPSDLTREIFDKVAILPYEHLPESIAILPCCCCSYSPAMNPDPSDLGLTFEWNRLSDMSRICRLKDEKRGTASLRAKEIMDALRVVVLMNRNPNITGWVQKTHDPCKNIVIANKNS
jgi:hypothetical protein